MRFRLGLVPRILITIAVPAAAIVLLWPIHWQTPMIEVRGKSVHRFTGTTLLRDDLGLQLAGIVAMLGWVYALWLRKSLWAADGGSPTSRRS